MCGFIVGRVDVLDHRFIVWGTMKRMVNDEAVKYFKEHKDVPRDVLRKQLSDAGYPAHEISRAEAAIDGDTLGVSVVRGKASSVGQALLGIVAAVIMYLILNGILDDLVAGAVGLGAQAVVAFKYWRTRRAFVLGFSIIPLIGAVIFGIFIMYMFSQW